MAARKAGVAITKASTKWSASDVKLEIHKMTGEADSRFNRLDGLARERVTTPPMHKTMSHVRWRR